MTLLLAIAIGGALGSIGRFLVSVWIQDRFSPHFPWATFLVNMVGSFLIGIAFGVGDAERYSGDLLSFLATGMLGGFTTFSTFSVENLSLLEGGRVGVFLFNAVYQLLGGLVLAIAGYWLISAVI